MYFWAEQNPRNSDTVFLSWVAQVRNDEAVTEVRSHEKVTQVQSHEKVEEAKTRTVREYWILEIWNCQTIL